ERRRRLGGAAICYGRTHRAQPMDAHAPAARPGRQRRRDAGSRGGRRPCRAARPCAHATVADPGPIQAAVPLSVGTEGQGTFRSRLSGRSAVVRRHRLAPVVAGASERGVARRRSGAVVDQAHAHRRRQLGPDRGAAGRRERSLRGDHRGARRDRHLPHHHLYGRRDRSGRRRRHAVPLHRHPALDRLRTRRKRNRGDLVRMTDTTPRSHLPLLAAAQAQKHVTHNEALLMLDALGCARLLDRDLSAPPPSPADGDTYLVKATATGDWTGQDGKIAFAVDGAWRFYAPYQGLIAYVADEAKLVAYDGSAWDDLASLLSLQNVPLLGVNTTADATNKLAVKSAALLFDNVGAGVQAKLNKHAASDTASLLYQTNYSGRAEFGLTGDDNFHCKVSPDGSSWTDALVVDKTSGALTLASGVKLPNGSASSPSLALNANSGLYWDAANSGVGLAIGGTQLGYFSANALGISV